MQNTVLGSIFATMTPFPAAFIEQCQKLLPGPDAEQLLSSLEEIPPVSLRLHPLKGNNLFSEAERVPWCPQGRYLTERPAFSLDPLLHAGAYYVQEAGSMFLEQAFSSLQLPENPVVLDLSAAPGGKTTHLLSLLQGKGLLLSNEPIASRVNPLIENSVKWGYPNQIITQNDPADFSKSGLLFDAIVLDAPCSGEGMFRKDPQSVAHWSPEHVQHCALRQKRILEDIWPCLKTGGFLIYSTCTFNRSENEEILNMLVEKREAVMLALPPILHNANPNTQNTSFARFWPHLVKSEGFSLGLVQKTSGPEIKVKASARQRISRLKSVPAEIPVLKKDHLLWFDPYPNTASVFPELFFEFAEQVKNTLRIRHMGTQMCEFKGKDLIFSHELSMSIYLNKDGLPVHEMSLPEAQNFLRKTQAHEVQREERFILSNYEHRPLGWLKKAGHRWNNLYPTEWRLRLQ